MVIYSEKIATNGNKTSGRATTLLATSSVETPNSVYPQDFLMVARESC